MAWIVRRVVQCNENCKIFKFTSETCVRNCKDRGYEYAWLSTWCDTSLGDCWECCKPFDTADAICRFAIYSNCLGIKLTHKSIYSLQLVRLVDACLHAFAKSFETTLHYQASLLLWKKGINTSWRSWHLLLCWWSSGYTTLLGTEKCWVLERFSVQGRSCEGSMGRKLNMTLNTVHYLHATSIVDAWWWFMQTIGSTRR